MRKLSEVTITYEIDQDGWVVASVLEVRGVHSQGRTRDEARANVLDAAAGMAELRPEDGQRATVTLTFEKLLVRARAFREGTTSDTTAAEEIRADRDR